jgi:hypothetical protein
MLSLQTTAHAFSVGVDKALICGADARQLVVDVHVEPTPLGQPRCIFVMSIDNRADIVQQLGELTAHEHVVNIT